MCSDLGAQGNKVCHYFHRFPIYLPLECWILSQLFRSPLSPSSIGSFVTFYQRVVSSVYFRLFIFLLAVLIPACASSNLAFRMMYSAYKLNKQGDNIQPWHTPFPIWSQFIVPLLVLLFIDLHTDFSRGRSGGLVFPYLEEFSVCGDPHSQRVWHIQ